MNYSFNKYFDVVYSSLTFFHLKDKLQVLEKSYSLLNKNGRLVVSIDKNDSKVIDYGSRKLEIFPISKGKFIELVMKTKFKMIDILEVEFAYIFVLEKE